MRKLSIKQMLFRLFSDSYAEARREAAYVERLKTPAEVRRN